MMVKRCPENPKTIGDHLRRRRLELGLLQKDLASKIDVHIETLKNWERGIGQPMIRQMPRIIQFLGYDPESIPENLPERIAYARRQLGYTQEALAKALGVDPTTIWRWERGDCPILDVNQQKITQLLEAGRIGKKPEA